MLLSRAFYGVGGDADAKPQLEEPEEGVKGELQVKNILIISTHYIRSLL